MTAPFELHAHSLALLQEQCESAKAGPMPEFQAHLALLRADLLIDLFPALLESMAGSDAVCIRAMQTGALARLDALDAAWRARGEAAPGQVQALQQAGRDLVTFEHAEVLPLAERLLDDHALARIRQGMHGRRAAT